MTPCSLLLLPNTPFAIYTPYISMNNKNVSIAVLTIPPCYLLKPPPPVTVHAPRQTTPDSGLKTRLSSTQVRRQQYTAHRSPNHTAGVPLPGSCVLVAPLLFLLQLPPPSSPLAHVSTPFCFLLPCYGFGGNTHAHPHSTTPPHPPASHSENHRPSGQIQEDFSPLSCCSHPTPPHSALSFVPWVILEQSKRKNVLLFFVSSLSLSAPLLLSLSLAFSLSFFLLSLVHNAQQPQQHHRSRFHTSFFLSCALSSFLSLSRPPPPPQVPLPVRKSLYPWGKNKKKRQRMKKRKMKKKMERNATTS